VTTVLAALDSNASGRPVLDTPIALANLYDSTVTCLHVREEALSAAAELARDAGVELREVGGAPIAEIANAARNPDVAALVLGARGLRGGPQPAGHTALDDTVKLAHQRGPEVLVLHVHSPATVPAFADHDPHAALAWEREFLTRYISTPHDRVTLLRRLGVPADDVVAVARETGADLIVLTWSQDLAPGRARVVSETLAHSDIPVLLLPVH
jgi:nucleotide-binding universal stress UspA family protein